MHNPRDFSHIYRAMSRSRPQSDRSEMGYMERWIGNAQYTWAYTGPREHYRDPVNLLSKVLFPERSARPVEIV